MTHLFKIEKISVRPRARKLKGTWTFISDPIDLMYCDLGLIETASFLKVLKYNDK